MMQRTRERGSMLIVALGILTLMSLLAVAFVKVVGIEKVASTNYVDSVKAKFLAEAGLQRVVADIRRTIMQEPGYSNPMAPWVYKAQGNEPRYDIPVEQVDPTRDTYFFDALGRSYPASGRNNPRNDWAWGWDIYRVKVIDTSAQIDLNGQQAALIPMLDALGQAIQLVRGVDNPIAQAQFGAFRGGAAIVEYRRTLDGQRFSSKTQLERIMPTAAYLKLRDYIATEAWVDDKAVVAAEGSIIAPTDVKVLGRAPLNVNLAQTEVIAAALAPLAGRRMMFYVTRTVQDIEAGNQPGWSGTPSQGGATLKEETQYEVRHNYVYIEPVGGEGLANMPRAIELARWIVSKRPFKSAQDFCSRLEDAVRRGEVNDSMLPDPAKSRTFFNATTMSPLNDLSAVYQKWPQDGAHADAFRSWHREAAVSVLKAAITPAFFSNTVNPNSAAYMPVDKGSLLYPLNPLVGTAESTLTPTQTVDFCYSTRGVFEITSLGEVRHFEDKDGDARGDIIAQEKIVTVVRLLDQVTHRTQLDFEKWDREYTAGTPFRLGVTTWPEPKFFWAGANLGTRQDLPPPDLAVDRFGHMELEPKNKRGPGGQLLPLGELGHAQFGNILFAAFFEHFWGTPPTMSMPMAAYLWADIAAGALSTGGDNWGRPYGVAPPGRTSPERAHPDRMRFVMNGLGQLFRDGVHSSVRGERDRHLWFRAGKDTVDPSDQGILGVAPPESDTSGTHHQGNLWYRKGGVEFWYKPGYDWSYSDPSNPRPGAPTGRAPTPMFCGLFFGSQVRFNPGNPEATAPVAPATGTYTLDPAPNGKPTDGTQVYVFRNSEGQIRATRLYYRVVGQDGNDIPIDFVDPDPGDQYPTGTIALYRRAAEAFPDKYPWPPVEFQKGNPDTTSTPPTRTPRDGDILFARNDAFVDFQHLAHWKSNEWHHIAIYWDDKPSNQTDPNAFLKIYVDGQQLSSAHRLPPDLNVEKNKYQFVRLNEDHAKGYPRDHVYIGSLERWQQASGEGIFKHRSTAGDSHIELFANGSIDDVVIYDGSQPQGTTLPRTDRLWRFEQRGRFTQHFDLQGRFPDGNKPLELAFFAFTAFLPTRHGGQAEAQTGRGSVAVTVRDESASLSLGRSFASNRDDASIRLIQGNGAPVFAFPPTVLSASGVPNNRILYDVTLNAATFDANGAPYPRMAFVDTPVFAEASISYFLPFEEVLLKERLLD